VCSLCYQGNHHDIPVFQDDLADMIATAKTLTKEAEVTLVFDTGNVSQHVMQHLQTDLYFVTALVPSDHESL
jgi:transposase